MRVGGLYLLHGVARAGLATVVGEVVDNSAKLGFKGDVSEATGHNCASGVSGRWFGTSKCSAAMLQSHSKMASSIAINSEKNIMKKTNASKAGENKATKGKRVWEQSRRSLGALVRTAKVFSGQCYKHTASLERAMENVKDSFAPTMSELDDRVAHWMNMQASSLDTCPVQLKKVKVELEKLHVMVTDLSAEIHSAEISIQTTTTELTNIHIEQGQNDELFHEETKMCEKKLAQDKIDKEKLEKEFLELQEIAKNSHHLDPTSVMDDIVNHMNENGHNTNFNFSSGSYSSSSGSFSYQNYPAPAKFWRVENAHPSTETPYIKSVEMFTDFNCMTPVSVYHPKAICSEMMVADSCSFLLHNPNNNPWYFKCDHCQTHEAWVGVELDNPAAVRCVHVVGTLSGQKNKGLLLSSSPDGTHWSLVSDVSNEDTVVAMQGDTSPQQQTAALASTRRLVALQEDVVPLHAAAKPRAKAPRRPTEQSVREPRLLAKKTKALANELMACLAKNKGGHVDNVEQTRSASLLEVIPPSPAAPTVIHGIYQCEEQRHILQITYTRAYVDLSRVISQYAKLVLDTTCFDAANETHIQRERPLSIKIETLSTSLTTQTASLQSYRVRIESLTRAEVKLRLLIITLTKKCAAMEETEDSLDKIRDAIHVLDLCPGLYSTVNFTIPRFIDWVKLFINAKTDTDPSIDEKMRQACSQLQTSLMTKAPRAAETAEIEQKTVQGAPNENTDARLLGTCPTCEGISDEGISGFWHASGHARICWAAEKEINEDNKQDDCSTGWFAVMCVVD